MSTSTPPAVPAPMAAASVELDRDAAAEETHTVSAVLVHGWAVAAHVEQATHAALWALVHARKNVPLAHGCGELQSLHTPLSLYRPEGHCCAHSDDDASATRAKPRVQLVQLVVEEHAAQLAKQFKQTRSEVSVGAVA